MREISVSITEVARNLSDFVNRVAYRGEHFVLTRGNKPVAELRAVPRGRRVRDLAELVRSMPHLTAGDAEAFERDLDAARVAMPDLPERDVWGS